MSRFRNQLYVSNKKTIDYETVLRFNAGHP